jgi:hypothetical protein
MILIVIDHIELELDIKNALRLIELSNNFFVENEEGPHPRTYLSKIIEAHQMFK